LPSTFIFIIATLLLSLNFVREGGLAISDWLYLFALGFAFLETLTFQKKKLNYWIKNPFIPLAAIIGLSATISTVNSKNVGIAFMEIFQQLFVITIFISIIWILISRGKIKSIILAFIYSGVFTASVATLDYFTGSRYGLLLSSTPDINLWDRYAGTLGHPNKFGYFLVLTLLLTIGYWIDRSKSQKRTTLYEVYWGVIILVQIFGVYLSNSVTAYIGLIVGLLVFAYSIMSNKIHFNNMIWISIFLLFISIFIILIFLYPYIKTSSAIDFIERGFERVITTTYGSRIVVLKVAWQRILKNPFIGVGYDQISTSSSNLVQFTLGSSIHNPLLQIWYTGGFFGFIGWIAIYIYLGWSATKVLLKKGDRSPIIISLVAAILSILVMDQFQDAIYQREKWLVIGLFVGWFWLHGRIGNTMISSNKNETVNILG
jgi:O-antigen ligase